MKKLFLLLLVLGNPAQAFMELGVGLTSATSGRLVPAAAGGVTISDWSVLGSAVGARSSYHYSNNYSLAGLRDWKMDNLFWGPVGAGVGLGVMFSASGFQDDSGTASSSTDFGAGPAFRLRWNFLGPVYMSMEAIWGLRSLSRHAKLNFQDLEIFSMGVEL